MTTEIIQQLRKAINNHNLKIEIYPDNSIYFLVYEVEVPIALRDGICYIEAELHNGIITFDMIEELSKFMQIIEDNKEEIKGWIKNV